MDNDQGVIGPYTGDSSTAGSSNIDSSNFSDDGERSNGDYQPYNPSDNQENSLITPSLVSSGETDNEEEHVDIYDPATLQHVLYAAKTNIINDINNILNKYTTYGKVDELSLDELHELIKDLKDLLKNFEGEDGSLSIYVAHGFDRSIQDDIIR
jgi:hypothetical protein